MCIFKPEYYILRLLLFNVIGLTHYTRHLSHLSRVTETWGLIKPVKPVRLPVQGSGDVEREGSSPSQVGRTPQSHQRHRSSGSAHVQKVRSYLMGKDGRGTPEGTSGNRRGFSAMQVPNSYTQIPSCLGSRTLWLSQRPVFPFKSLLDVSKCSPSSRDKNLKPACSHQLQHLIDARQSLRNSVLEHYPKRTMQGVWGCVKGSLKIMSNKAQSNWSVSMF